MMKNLLFTLLILFAGTFAFAQTTITGKIMDGDENMPLIGASVLVSGTSTGTVTDIDGNFTLETDENAGVLIITYTGYEPMRTRFSGSANLGELVMEAGTVGLEAVVVTGNIDLVEDRKTPVAASVIPVREIQLKLGNQEFPEIMKNTPSIYATKQGGGYGDSRINVRGFNQRNVAVIINGQPVNDMENGWVYWSNWQGLQDVASGIEIQRGLGASKLAVPSVGGSINIITKATEADRGGFVNVGVGNDGYLKTTASVSTGVGEKGWSATALLGRWQGDGWVDGTQGEGLNYLAAVGYQPNAMHSFNLTYTGAAQWHHQRSAWLTIRDYENYGGDDFRKFNADWGMLDGEEYSFRRNFYNKPIATLNWDWNITENLTLATSAYGSWGRGGGTGPRGRNFGIYPFREDLTQAISDGDLPYRTSEGLIDFDAVVANNQAGTPYTGGIGYFDGSIVGSNGFREDGVNTNVAIRRASVNSHNWYGAISNLEYNVNEWTFGLGVDWRTYRGLHYRVLNDLMGLDGYYSTGNRYSEGKIVISTSEAKPFKNISESEKIDYYNIGEVGWLGVNGLAEYDSDKLTAVIQAGLSNQNYKRIDYFDQFPHESEDHDMTGGFVKGGVNFKLNDQHNIFGNAGFIKKQPLFDAVFPNFGNDVNRDVENEDIVSFELGYGFRSPALDANINLYNTNWSNRWISRGINLDGGLDGTAVFSGVENIHRGLEIDFKYRPVSSLDIKGMASFGDWQYGGDVNATVFDDSQNQIGESTLYLDGVKVGDAAQTTLSLGADYEIVRGFSVDATFNYFDNLYADFAPDDSEFLSPDNLGAVELPSYNTVDFGMTYRTDIGKSNFLTFRFNMNNVFDTEYIAESQTNIHAGATEDTYNGVSRANYVWWGFGRTWNASVKLTF